MVLTRQEWCVLALRICTPVLQDLANQTFKHTFIDNKKPTACLEAFARVLFGISYWIENGQEPEVKHLANLARQAIDSATNPLSQDYMNFSANDQVLVECAILAQALIRAPNELWHKLPLTVKKNVIIALKTSRQYRPHDNNWVLFPSMVEAFFLSISEQVNNERLMQGITAYNGWYVGDGMYSDGEEYHNDYYNSFIIHPMLYDILRITSQNHTNKDIDIKEFQKLHRERMKRYAIHLERCIAPDGTFPSIGRSITYRSGAFHALALCAYTNNLTSPLTPAKVRTALSLVIQATLQHPNTFENGWLTLGLYGKQPQLAEPYINNGSVYMATTIFLPLGLHHTSSFWNDAYVSTTWKALLGEGDIERDKPYVECKRKHGKFV